MQVGDLTQVKENDFKVLKAGTYTFKIVKAEETVAKSSGNPMIKLELMQEEEGVKLFDNVPIMDKMLWKVKHLVEGTQTTLLNGELDVNDLLGKYVDVKVKVEKDDCGDDRNKVADYVVPKVDKAKEESIGTVL